MRGKLVDTERSWYQDGGGEAAEFHRPLQCVKKVLSTFRKLRQTAQEVIELR